MNTANKGLAQPANNSFIGTWDVPMNSNFGLIDQCFGGVINFAVSTANIALSSTDIQNFLIQLNGTLSNNILLIFPVGIGGTFVINNATSGMHTITAIVNGAPGTSIVLPQGRASLIYGDGTNMVTPSGGFSAVDGVTITGAGSVVDPLVAQPVTQPWWYTDAGLVASNSHGFSSITRAGAHNSVFVFSTPQPDTNYAVIMTPYVTITAANNFGCVLSTQSTTGFTINAASGVPGTSQIYVALAVVR